MDILTLSIGIGLFVSLAFSEFFGIAAGGLVVPGYIALQLHNPLTVLFTIGLGCLTYGVGLLVSRVTILYGKRKTAFLLILGFVLGALSFELLRRAAGSNHFIDSIHKSGELAAIGHILPGLIALWMDRQGVLETISALVTGAVIVRLTLILILGSEFQL
ncbi:poly-gamma-glutamate biosynthesis protein PgsC [Leptospira perolatii]|uniref:Poly-gamma-glutamate biosynthesis protein PgsC n=1 Tax=Leptospira perolatii TaxID=2023191 RepID=A0A2M9ZQX2_9LEPT|nr:poly-gamma-glutamate biosynthesis protein PgsC [Leptospira perolatii]PJZ70535.1 poly-gamma-glutamate biosynthesis protein PgsC [Leptospira perolatii]PJZ74371.1 poly-gamma-glutamate biosynthesis protein PgsC [Leptospira perolatii]